MPHLLRPNELVVSHPALMGGPEATGLSGTFQFSYEFATFMVAYERGEFDHTDEVHQRCLKISKRRSCYRDELINQLGYLTDVGVVLHNDAFIALDRIVRYSQQNGISLVQCDQATKMDEVLIKGTLSLSAVLIMRKLYELVPIDERKYQKTHKILYEPKMEYTFVDGLPVLLTRSVHANNDLRIGLEQLTKFGIADQVTLPRTPRQMGRGRAPVAARLSSVGIIFLEDFLEQEDTTVKHEIKQAHEIKQMMEPRTPFQDGLDLSVFDRPL